jgi:hypothetical protein
MEILSVTLRVSTAVTHVVTVACTTIRMRIAHLRGDVSIASIRHDVANDVSHHGRDTSP